MKKILLIEARSTIGGGQVVSRDICRVLSEDHDVVVCLPSGETPLSRYLGAYKQVVYHHIELSRGGKRISDYFSFLRNFLSLWRALWTELKEKDYEIVYVQHLSVLPIVVMVSTFLKVTVIAHVHVVYQDKVAHWLIDKCLKASIVKRIIGVSDYSLSQLCETNRLKSNVVHNHVSLGEIKARYDRPSGRVAIVGDVAENKGHEILVDALQILNLDIECHIIGNIVDDEIANRLRKKSRSLIFTGMIADVRDYLQNKEIDLVVNTSILGETFSLAMVEVWSIGLPTVATNDMGMKELVEKFLPLYAGDMLFEKANPGDLSVKMRRMLENAELRERIGRDAYDVVNENFNFETFKTRILENVKATEK